jgi:hypothetical protein
MPSLYQTNPVKNGATGMDVGLFSAAKAVALELTKEYQIPLEVGFFQNHIQIVPSDEVCPTKYPEYWALVVSGDRKSRAHEVAEKFGYFIEPYSDYNVTLAKIL